MKKLAVFLLVWPVFGFAQHATLKEVAQVAVEKSPEVQARWHNLRAAADEVDVARGGFFPRVDATAGSGRESLKTPTAATLNYNRHGYTLSLNQMIFDGFATPNEVKRLNKAKLVRFYEFLDASENAALEAARAYYDVIRYRHLLNLAEDNYVQHKATYEQLVLRTQSGVGRRADMEQAGSRLALAESNLNTEVANLHDVTARYLRVVGEQPPTIAFGPLQLEKHIPLSAKEALQRAYTTLPSLLSTVENLESSAYDHDIRRAAFMPRVDLKARTDNITNYQGVMGDRVNNVLEVAVNYNLFNGGSDLARQRQYAARKYQAQDLRDKACRDARQTLSIAYNDIGRLKDQIASVSQQVALIEKTRDAYRDQFNVGQRTLLDLLDTENELLNARRALVNADTDLSLAYLRTYAGMGKILEFLGLRRLETAEVDPSRDRFAEVNAAELCPPEAPAVASFDRTALDARADRLLAEYSGKTPLPNALPPAISAAPAVPSATVSEPSGRAWPSPLVAVERIPEPSAAALPKGFELDVLAQIKGWADAWMRKDLAAYSAYYGPYFTPEGGVSREDWAEMRRTRLIRPSEITIEIQNLVIRQIGINEVVAEFRQVYRSNLFQDVSAKVLEFNRHDGKWLIQRENSVPVGRRGGLR